MAEFSLNLPPLKGGMDSAGEPILPEAKGFGLNLNLNDLLNNPASGSPTVPTAPKNAFADVEDVALDDPTYYPVNQPYVPRVLIKFPTVTETPEKTVSSLDLTDNKYLEVYPNNLLSFSCNIITDTVARMTLSLFDPSWGEIEETLVKNRGIFALRFGYPENFVSPWYKVQTTGYSLEFKQSGIIIHIAGIMTGFQLNLTKKFKGFGDKNQLISDIVEEIVQDINNSGDKDFQIKKENVFIEKTSSVFSRDKISDPSLGEKLFQQSGQTDIEFICNELAKYAISADTNQGDYKFFIDVDPVTNDIEFHFHSMMYKVQRKGNQPSSQFNLQGGRATTAQQSTTKKVPAFTMFKEKNTPLINFSPLWNQTVANITGSSGNFSAIIDLNKTTFSQVKSASNTPVVTDNSGGIVDTQKEVKDDPEQTVQKKSNAGKYTPGGNVYALVAEETSKQTQAIMGAIRAEIEIVGNPRSFRIFDKIAVLVYSPRQSNENEKLVHWISGYFRILGITHIIQAGKYTTKLHLMTDVRQTVYTDKITTIPSKT